VNKDGVASVEADLSQYNTLIVLACDKGTVAQKLVDLPVSPFSKRNLSLSNPLNKEKGYNEARNTATVQKLESHFIEDINSTEVQTVDDLKKVSQVLQEISKNIGANGGNLSDFGFIMKWPSLTSDQKNTHYESKTSHELNLFTYFKDPTYFSTVVKPFIACKLEKTFIDYYLLDMKDQVVECTNIAKLVMMNALEKCLLVEALMRHGLKDDAAQVVRHLEDEGSVFEKQVKADANKANRLFDIVLSLNALKSAEQRGDLHMFMEEDAKMNEREARSSSQFGMPPPPQAPGGPPIFN
jgi:hypothetical protein